MFSQIICLIIAGIFMVSNPTTAQDSSIDSTISILYESISFDQNNPPDYNTFKALFADKAHLISVKDTTSYKLSPDDYEKSMTRQRDVGNILAFEEKELHRRTDQYGKILHIFSTYQTHLKTPDGTETARGINSIQLMRKDGNWKVTSLIWYEEDKNHPLPEKYLPLETEY